MLSQSGHSIYTELLFTPKTTYEDSDGQLNPDQVITIIVPGGSVQTKAGVATYLVDPCKMFVQPKKRYLLALSHNADGQFYTLTKNWDLTSGAVQPNSEVEQKRAGQGKATLIGLSEDQLPSALKKLLTAQSQ